MSPAENKNANDFLSYPPLTLPTCIPVVPTGCPRQLGGEAVEEVEDGPGEDYYIVHVKMSFNHLRSITDP